MAIEPASYGYPKASITANKLPVWQQPLSRFSVAGPNDWKVSVLSSIDRGIRIEAGVGSGDAVTDEIFDYETMSLPTPPIASAWYLIVRRRNWSGTGTSTLVAIRGTDEKRLPGREDKPGEVSDQPLALVRVTQKDSTVQEVIDLRCFASNGGVEVIDKLALSYLETPGAEVKLGTSIWRYESKGNGVWGWGEHVAADPPRWGAPTVTTNSAGFGSVAFSPPFPSVGFMAIPINMPPINGGQGLVTYRLVGVDRLGFNFQAFASTGEPVRNTPVVVAYIAHGK